MNLLLHTDILCLWESIYIWWFLTNINFYLVGIWRTVFLLWSLSSKPFFYLIYFSVNKQHTISIML